MTNAKKTAVIYKGRVWCWEHCPVHIWEKGVLPIGVISEWKKQPRCAKKGCKQKLDVNVVKAGKK